MCKIRVLQLITRLIVGGAQEHAMLTADFLGKNRYEVEVWSGPQTGSEGSLKAEFRRRGIKLEFIPELVREINSVKDFLALFKIIRKLKKQPFDIIHTNSSKAGILGRLAAKLAGVPIVVHTVHGWSFHDHMRTMERKIYIALEKWTGRFTDKFITVTDLDIKKGLDAGISKPDKYVTIHSAIEIERYRTPTKNREEIISELGLDPSKITVGTVSRMSQQKAPIGFLNTAKMICEKYDNVQFLFIGDGPLRQEVENFIMFHHLENKVFIPGIRYDVPNMLAVMDIFILNSLWEGLPRVFPQAMAASLPIIATKVNGAPEAIENGKNGFLVTPGKPEEMVEKIGILLNDKNRREEMGKTGYGIVDLAFNAIHMIEQIEKVYENCLKQKK